MDNYDFKTFILAASLIVSNGVTIFLYLKSKMHAVDEKIEEKLFKLQNIALNNPFLEDERFAKGWIKFKNEYNESNKDDYDYNSNMKYLQYDQYCEMLFNFISEIHTHYPSEEKILNKIDFKSWIRVHSLWWKKPLLEHSNHDIYEKPFSSMIDSWLK